MSPFERTPTTAESLSSAFAAIAWSAMYEKLCELPVAELRRVLLSLEPHREDVSRMGKHEVADYLTGVAVEAFGCAVEADSCNKPVVVNRSAVLAV